MRALPDQLVHVAFDVEVHGSDRRLGNASGLQPPRGCDDSEAATTIPYMLATLIRWRTMGINLV